MFNKKPLTTLLTKERDSSNHTSRRLRPNASSRKPTTTKVTADATDLYLKEIGRSPLLTAEEEVALSRRAQRGDEGAKKRFIESNLRLVVKIAKRYVSCGMPILDLIEEGNLGLIKAIKRFDPERGFRFSTYGAWWIQQHIERAIMNQGRTVRLPIHIAKQLNRCLRAERALSKTISHAPTPMDIANFLQKPAKEVENALSWNERIVSIDAPISPDTDKSFADILSAEDADPMECLLKENFKTQVLHWLSQLTERQRSVIVYRFGLSGMEPCTLEETGAAIGLTRERVRQLQTEAIETLQGFIQKEHSPHGIPTSHRHH